MLPNSVIADWNNMDCFNADFGKDYCGIFKGRYKAVMRNGQERVLCANCLGRWMIIANAVVSYETLPQEKTAADSDYKAQKALIEYAKSSAIASGQAIIWKPGNLDFTVA